MDAVATGAALLASLLAGAILVAGSHAGYLWQSAAGALLVAFLVPCWVNGPAGIALFGLSFLGVFHPALRIEVGGLWMPPPVLVAGFLLARELTRAAVDSEVRRPALPAASLALLSTGLVLSGVSAVDPTAFLAGLVKWATHIFVFVGVVFALRRAAWVLVLTDALTLVVGVVAAYGLYRIAVGEAGYIDVFEGIASRSAASFYFTAVLPLVFARLLPARGAERLLRAGLLAVLVVAQVFTYTRAGWVASTLGLLLVAGRRVRWHVGFALAALMLAMLAPQDVFDRFMSIFIVTDVGVDSPYSSSTIGRSYLVRTALNVLSQNWLLGVGIGNYDDIYHHFAVPGATLVSHTPHNFYLYLWAEGGILSLISFLAFYGSRLHAVWDARRNVTGIERAALMGFVGSFAAMAIEAGFEDDLNVILTWTLLAAGTALAQLVREEP